MIHRLLLAQQWDINKLIYLYKAHFYGTFWDDCLLKVCN